MPLYHQIVTASARASPAALADLLRHCAKQITASGGIVRSCEHHGVKRLPHRVRSRHASAGDDGRYHHIGHRVAFFFDCGPAALPRVEQTLRMHADVLRFTTLRRPATMDLVNSNKKGNGNPWSRNGK